MKKIICFGLMMTLMLSCVNAIGIGIIENMDFGEVQKGQTYTKQLMIWAMDNQYAPYTSVPVPTYNQVSIKVDYTDKYVTCLNNYLWHVNEYTNIPVTLTIPNNAKKGYYESNICGTVCPSTDGIGMCVGACTKIKYTITEKLTKREQQIQQIRQKMIDRVNHLKELRGCK